MLSEAHPRIRRILRFLALPYYYFFYVNWNDCKVGRYKVIKDFLYIYLKLKYTPDNYSLCRLWEVPQSYWSYYYGSVYDPYQRSKLRKEVFPIRYRIIYDDKPLCHQLCNGLDIPIPKSFGVVSQDVFHEKIKKIFTNYHHDKFIVKPISGRGGEGIFITYLKDNQIYVQSHKKIANLSQFELQFTAVVQEYIQQHNTLNQISNSCNTVRIVTMLAKNGDVILIGAFMRFGVDGAFLDNTSQGGVKVGVNLESGRLKEIGCDKKGLQYTKHPTTGFVFNGFKIPFWEELLNLATKIQKGIAYNKMMGQDIAIGPKGPILIEINAEYDNVGLEQACGPILANKDVKQEFEKYDLLINKYQKRLFR